MKYHLSEYSFPDKTSIITLDVFQLKAATKILVFIQLCFAFYLNLSIVIWNNCLFPSSMSS